MKKKERKENKTKHSFILISLLNNRFAMLIVFFLKNIKVKNIKYQLKCYQVLNSGII